MERPCWGGGNLRQGGRGEEHPRSGDGLQVPVVVILNKDPGAVEIASGAREWVGGVLILLPRAAPIVRPNEFLLSLPKKQLFLNT